MVRKTQEPEFLKLSTSMESNRLKSRGKQVNHLAPNFRNIRCLGMHHSTLCLWLQGKIKGHHVKIEETLEQWLNGLQMNKSSFSKNATTKLFGNKAPETRETAVEFEGARQPSRNFHLDEDLIPIRIDIENEGIRFKENIFLEY